jgi:hypothetical protein
LVGREFDGPGPWWPDQPDVIGGCDRQAGGTWCACDVRTGTIAVVLNRPDRPQAQPGAASRGVLPLLAVSHGNDWPDRVDLAPMASFNLMLVTGDSLTWWTFDGSTLVRADLAPGLHMAKPRGLVDPPLDQRLTDPEQWRAVLAATELRPDPSGLLVRIERGDHVYATVFAQFISAEPGFLTIEHSRTPQQPETFEHGEWRDSLNA